MAAIKISTLTAKTVPVAADSFVIVDSAAADNKKVSYSDLRSTILDAETTINESGADVDFRVESDTKTHALFVQGSDGFVGIGTGTPATELEVNGNIGFTSDGQGINFGNSSGGVSGSSTSTVLDDYEEGTWTPSFATGFAAPTYGTQTGFYTKIGNKVFAHWIISGGDATTGIPITVEGLPYICRTGIPGAVVVTSVAVAGNPSFTDSLNGEVTPATDTFSLYKSEPVGGFTGPLTSTDTNGSFTIFGYATYLTS